jgi:hypothetical protein
VAKIVKNFFGPMPDYETEQMRLVPSGLQPEEKKGVLLPCEFPGRGSNFLFALIEKKINGGFD